MHALSRTGSRWAVPEGSTMNPRPGSVSGEAPLLIPMHGPGERKPRQLDHVVATIGRARGCELCLDASDVSTVHCLVYRSPDGYRVRDCNSRTGTRVNGNGINGSQRLNDGDILNVGPFSFEVKLPRPPKGAAAPPPTVGQALSWQASRQRLAQHALRYRRLAQGGAGDHDTPRLREKALMLDRRLAELEEAEVELRAEREALVSEAPSNESRTIVVQTTEALQHERQEIDRMRQQLEKAQADAQASFDKQRAGLAQQEATLRMQRADLARMMEQLRALQEELRKPHKAELQALSEENQRLRQAIAELGTGGGSGGSSQELEDARAEVDLLRELLEDREKQLGEAQVQLATKGAGEGDLDSIVAENDLLKKLLAEKDELVDELRVKAAPKPAKSATELERYESELNEDRRQLEAERSKLHTEIEALRQRNQELDEATRELEMEMSRERAELARERMRMERMRDELKTDMEKMQREMGVRESLAPVQRLRDEMKRPAARSLRGNDTPRG